LEAADAALQAENGAFLTRAIPGAGDKALEVTKLAQKVFEKINEPFPPP
jgi:methylthioribose-1-phosphate isomerase